jgi:hypothetical protein
MKRTVALALVVLAVGGASACSQEERHPIRVDGRVLTVENMTADEWRNVEVWLNDHYRVTRSKMPAGERFGIPLDAFVAGFGQRFNPARQVVQGIEVTATTPAGKPVTLVWGRGRRR